MKEKNYPKLAQAMGLHTIHCSETDDQVMTKPPIDIKTKFYNTWSCRGFLTEGFVPIQVARGSHENEGTEDFPVVRNGTCIMSWAPSRHYIAKSYVPFKNSFGMIIPHGEAYTIRENFYDKETGYAPSQYYVYQYSSMAKDFIDSLPLDATLSSTNPEMEVVHPMDRELTGYDRVGAMLIFNNNRGWWTGSVMDEIDSAQLFDYKFGPTVLQVAGGVFAGFSWACQNPNAGNKWPDMLDSDYIIEAAKPFIGRFYSAYIDLTKTHIKDCQKLESFIVKKYEGITNKEK